MMTLINILDYLLGIAYYIILIHVVMSWLISFQVLNLHQPFVAQVWYGLNRLLAPIYDPIRRRLPNLGALDITPLVVFIGIIILRGFILPDLARALS